MQPHVPVHRRVQLGADRAAGLPIVERHQAGVGAHAELVHHLPRHAGRVLEVGLGAAGHRVVAEHDLLGRAAAESLADLPLEIAAGVQHLLAGGEVGDAHGLPARLDGDLVQSVLGVEEEPASACPASCTATARHSSSVARKPVRSLPSSSRSRACST